VADRVRCWQSDVFDQVQGRFDLIIFDPPFRWFPPRDLLDAAITDKDYQALTRFMAEAPTHLHQGGRILLDFGTSGDLDYLLALIDRNGFLKEVVSEFELVRQAWTVTYYVFRLTLLGGSTDKEFGSPT
jgi:release factor glutamine methyltransferase